MQGSFRLARGDMGTSVIFWYFFQTGFTRLLGCFSWHWRFSEHTKFDKLVKSRKSLKTSFRRKPESSDFSMFWMPDQVRHDELGLFTKSSTFDFASSAFSKGLLKHKATQVISVDTRLNFPYTSFQKNEVISHFQQIFVNSNHYTKCVLRILSSF